MKNRSYNTTTSNGLLIMSMWCLPFNNLCHESVAMAKFKGRITSYWYWVYVMIHITTLDEQISITTLDEQISREIFTSFFSISDLIATYLLFITSAQSMFWQHNFPSNPSRYLIKRQSNHWLVPYYEVSRTRGMGKCEPCLSLFKVPPDIWARKQVLTNN